LLAVANRLVRRVAADAASPTRPATAAAACRGSSGFVFTALLLPILVFFSFGGGPFTVVFAGWGRGGGGAGGRGRRRLLAVGFEFVDVLFLPRRGAAHLQKKFKVFDKKDQIWTRIQELWFPRSETSLPYMNK
jgi:hypothetical protein